METYPHYLYSARSQSFIFPLVNDKRLCPFLVYKRGHTYSDFGEAYRRVLDSATHQCVGKETGQTAHVERWNNTLRQRLARFVRKTLSFSKSDEFHEIALKLFIFQYNLDCVA